MFKSSASQGILDGNFPLIHSCKSDVSAITLFNEAYKRPEVVRLKISISVSLLQFVSCFFTSNGWIYIFYGASTSKCYTIHSISFHPLPLTRVLADVMSKNISICSPNTDYIHITNSYSSGSPDTSLSVGFIA